MHKCGTKSFEMHYSVQEFLKCFDQNISGLIYDLKSDDYCVGPYNRFTIYDPKERIIHAPDFRDRILHHAVLNQCEPVFERRLIYDTYACRKGKGQHKALLRAVKFAKKYNFFLKMDIRSYFNSIDHDILLNQLKRVFRDTKLIAVFTKIIYSYCVSDGKGLPIGALMSQFFANMYLDPLDRVIKESFRCRAYIRYMDDFVIWSDQKSALISLRDDIVKFLTHELALDVKEYPFINRSTVGMEFLGFRVFPGWIQLSKRSKRRLKYKLGQYMKAYGKGDVDEMQLQKRLQSLVAFPCFCRSWHFRKRIFVEDLGKVQWHEPGESGWQLE